MHREYLLCVCVCVQTDNKEVFHVLMTVKNTIEPFFNSSMRKYVT